MNAVDPNDTFPGKILIIAPHMDDEALACGGLIARLEPKERIFLAYATDGMKSPAPIVPGRDAISPDLGKIRVQEAAAAMAFLGVPETNLHFLNLPEAALSKHVDTLRDRLLVLIRDLQPETIFIPFRFDRHPDHLAINHVVIEGSRQKAFSAQVIEYFVYHRWRLLPKRDIRKYVRPAELMQIDITPVAVKKRKALDFYTSQTTRYYPWQTRPILTPQLLDDESGQPETFIKYNPALPGAAVFSRLVLWIRIAHRLEPVLLKWKYLSLSFLKRALRIEPNSAG